MQRRAEAIQEDTSPTNRRMDSQGANVKHVVSVTAHHKTQGPCLSTHACAKNGVDTGGEIVQSSSCIVPSACAVSACFLECALPFPLPARLGSKKNVFASVVSRAWGRVGGCWVVRRVRGSMALRCSLLVVGLGQDLHELLRQNAGGEHYVAQTH